MNRVFFAMIASAIGFAAFREIVWTTQSELLVALLNGWLPEVQWIADPLAGAVAGARAVPGVVIKAPMEAVSAGLFDAVKASVSLAISLIGAMAFFLGLMKVAEDGGMLRAVARAIRPVMELLFPEVPADHPAMGAMIMNMSANALGLGNAATPFGIKAMQELDTLNPEKGTATNAMALFLAINTSGVTILPTGVIALRDVMHSSNPAGILGTTLFATLFSTAAGITAAKLYQRFSADPAGKVEMRPLTAVQIGILFLYLLGIAIFIALCLAYGAMVSPWIVPMIVLGFLSWGFFAGVPVYESFVEGAKEGFNIATKIIPYLVAILGAVGMLRASGALGLFVALVGRYTMQLGMPAEALPMALLRPLSGSGANGVMMEIMRAEGPDSYVGYLVSTLQGSTETTFYVIAVYFGAIQVTRIRHAMAAALTADLFGIIGAIVACQLYFALNGLWL